MTVPDISIIIPCRNEGINVANTISSILNTPTNIDFEIIVIDDGSIDGCCSFLRSKHLHKKIRLLTSDGVGACLARNKGAFCACTDYLLFCDAHIFVEPYWLDRLLSCFNDETGIVSPGIASPKLPDVVGYGMTLTESFGVRWLGHPGKTSSVLVAPGGCALVKRKTFISLGGFDRDFKVWGHEDVELSLKYWLFGYKILINPAVKILHIFREKHPYTVSMDYIYYNYLRIALSHFNSVRIKKMLSIIKNHPLSEEIITDVILSNIWAQRKKYFSTRLFDDDWLFQKFSVPF